MPKIDHRNDPRLPVAGKRASNLITISFYDEDLDALDAMVADQKERKARQPSRAKLVRLGLDLLGELKPTQITELLAARKP